MDSCSELQTLIFLNANSSSGRSLFFIESFLNLLLHYLINFMFGVPFLFLKIHALILFYLLYQCLGRGALIRSMSARAVVLVKLLSSLSLIQVLTLRIDENQRFPFLGTFLVFLAICRGEHLVGFIFLSFQSLSLRILPQHGQDHVKSCVCIHEQVK